MEVGWIFIDAWMPVVVDKQADSSAKRTRRVVFTTGLHLTIQSASMDFEASYKLNCILSVKINPSQQSIRIRMNVTQYNKS